jgi:hypothetical protein
MIASRDGPSATLGHAHQAGAEQPVRVRSATIISHLARIELVYAKASTVCTWCGSEKDPAMEALTPASPDSLPPVGDLVADEPFWRYPLGATARQGVTHLRVWRTADPEPGHLAVVTLAPCLADPGGTPPSPQA